MGTENYLGQQQLVSFFRAVLMSRVKAYMAQYMKNNAVSIFEIDEHLTIFSETLHERLRSDFLDYGIALEKFFVTQIVKPDGDHQYEQFKDLHFRQYADIAEAKLRQQTELINAQTEAQKVVIDSQAQATKRQQEGYTYAQERGFDVAGMVARNDAVGQFTNLGVGLGTMAGVGGSVAGMVGSAISNTVQSAPPIQSPNVEAFCDNCGAKLAPGIAFCEECGTPIPQINSKCVNCGYVFERPGKFCPKCGTKRG